MANDFSADLEAEVKVLMLEGRKAAAVKRVSEELGIGLAEAKEAVERFILEHGAGGHAPGPAASARPGGGPFLPPHIQNEIALLLSQHKPIEAIKHFREATGASLKDAAAAIERMSAREDPDEELVFSEGKAPAIVPGGGGIGAAVMEEIVALLGQGRKIEAIKRVREATGLGLKEAKDAVENLERGPGPAAATRKDATAPSAAGPDPNDYEEGVADLLRSGRRGEAVRYYMAATGEPEARAKKAVERIGLVSGAGKKSGCFIATACYGSADAPEVALLREFRDRRLLASGGGRFLVGLYYFFSPVLADFLRGHGSLRRAARALVIGPLVKLISR